VDSCSARPPLAPCPLCPSLLPSPCRTRTCPDRPCPPPCRRTACPSCLCPYRSTRCHNEAQMAAAGMQCCDRRVADSWRHRERQWVLLRLAGRDGGSVGRRRRWVKSVQATGPARLCPRSVVRCESRLYHPLLRQLLLLPRRDSRHQRAVRPLHTRLPALLLGYMEAMDDVGSRRHGAEDSRMEAVADPPW